MGVDSKLFVTAKREWVLDVMPKVITEINKWQRNLLDQYWDKKGFDSRVEFLFRNKEIGVNKDLKDFSNGIHSINTHDFGSFYINFTVRSEKRNLFITHTCSNDYSEIYKGDKIIFSLGCWGMSEEIMMVVAHAVKEFGDVYYVYDDCSDDFKKIEFVEEISK